MKGKTIIMKYCGDDFEELVCSIKYGYKHRKSTKMRKFLARKAKRNWAKL